MWNLPGPGIEPVSLALAEGFLTTESPGKPVSPYALWAPLLSRPHPGSTELISHRLQGSDWARHPGSSGFQGFHLSAGSDAACVCLPPLLDFRFL